ncbi:MAG: ECF transporter S component [Clostridia bacterium]|nr:ECF transporter S component [Clostridia bacterium]
MKKKASEKVPAPLKHGALIFILSLIGQPTLQGYIHPADPFVLLAATRLPTKQALLACGIASAASDLLKGYYATAPFTLAIKLLMVLAVKALLQLKGAKKNPELMVSIAALIPVPGYYAAQLIKWQVYSWISGHAYKPLYWANASLTKNLIQAVASVLIFIVLCDLIKGWRKVKQTAAEIKAEQQKEKEEQSE